MGIYFLMIALLTVYFSVKLSTLADKLKSKSNLSNAIAGGLLLALITALPEFITSVSSVLLGNPSMAIGNTLGSVFFNMQILMLVSIVYLRRRFFNRLSSTYSSIMAMFLLCFALIFFTINNNIKMSINHISVTSLFIFFIYILYLINSSRHELDEDCVACDERKMVLYIKFILTGFIIVFLSYNLTKIANEISITYDYIGSSAIGAFLLGITTSLPEVVSVITLVTLRNYDMALFNIIGSVFLNFIILSISDVIYKTSSIYLVTTFEDLLIIKLAFISAIMLAIQVMKRKKQNTITYLIPSFISVMCYSFLWYLLLVK